MPSAPREGGGVQGLICTIGVTGNPRRLRNGQRPGWQSSQKRTRTIKVVLLDKGTTFGDETDT